MTLCIVAGLLLLAEPIGLVVAAEGKSGEELFKEKCAACHKDGGNIVNPAKTLKRKDLDAAGLKSADDIVKFVRKPGKGMPVFDSSALPDNDAKALAGYILKTFK